MSATITVEMDNAAFEDNPGVELARILRRLADHVEARDGGRAGGWQVMAPPQAILRDVNGNAVGTFAVIQ